MFNAVLKKTIRNLEKCTEANMIVLILDRLHKVNSIVAGKYFCSSSLCKQLKIKQ